MLMRVPEFVIEGDSFAELLFSIVRGRRVTALKHAEGGMEGGAIRVDGKGMLNLGEVHSTILPQSVLATFADEREFQR